MSTLVQLVNEAQLIANALIEADGVISPEIEMHLDGNTTSLAAKADSYSSLIQALKDRAAFAAERSEEWDKIALAAERSREYLTAKLHNALKMLDMAEIAGGEYLVKRVANPPKVMIEDETKIPGEFLVTETTTRVDKKAISECLKNGVEVPGAHLERGEKLVFKAAVKK